MIKTRIYETANPFLSWVDYSFFVEMPGCYPTGRYKFIDDTMHIEYTFNKKGFFKTKTKTNWISENNIMFEEHSDIFNCDNYSTLE